MGSSNKPPETRFGTEKPSMPISMMGNMRMKTQNTMSPKGRRRDVPLAMVADIINENEESLAIEMDHTKTLDKLS